MNYRKIGVFLEEWVNFPFVHFFVINFSAFTNVSVKCFESWLLIYNDICKLRKRYLKSKLCLKSCFTTSICNPNALTLRQSHSVTATYATRTEIYWHTDGLVQDCSIFSTLAMEIERKNNEWVTVNNEFLVTSEVIWQWKSLANHLTSDQNIGIHGNECIILFLTRYFMSWAHSFAKNNRRSFILSLSPRKVFLP